MTLSLAACGSKAEPSADPRDTAAAPSKTDTKGLQGGHHQAAGPRLSGRDRQRRHRASWIEIAADKNVKIEYEVTSGQGDQTILKQLSDQAIADGVDAIIPIATTAAQIAALSAEETKTPVVYAAVSDPETAKLTGH